MTASPFDLPIRDGLVLPAAELRWRFSRASGPGGQGVNTTDSRVELVWDPGASGALPAALRQRVLERLGARLVDGVLVVVASEHRSQWQNRQAALGRLAVLLRRAIAPPPPPRRATRPSRGSVQRRLAAKTRRSAIKGQRQGRIRPEED
jgi:ribosome-associated protein